MNFKIKMNNIGKLKGADISVRPLTLLAGPNNTGKSFFSKALYSVFSVTNDNPLSAYIKDRLYPLQEGMTLIERGLDNREDYIKGYVEDFEDEDPGRVKLERNELNELSKLRKKIKTIQSAERRLRESLSFFNDSKSEQVVKEAPLAIKKDLKNMVQLYKNLLEDKNFKKKKTGSLILDNKENQILNNQELEKVNACLRDLEKREALDRDLKSEELMDIGFSKILEDNLTGNFQIPHLRKLIRDHSTSGSINIESQNKSRGIPDICKVIVEENKIRFQISLKGLTALQGISRVLYIESPFYWKLRGALARSSPSPSFLKRFFFPSGRKSLLVPKYFNDLAFMLTDELSGDMAFPEVFQYITTEIIKGKVVVDESGALQFVEGKKAHSLPMTATGAVQMGFLALLIEKKILDKQTVLFIDEPETNLHPAWQVEMMKVLFELVKAGAYVITATHSVDMLKWLETHLKDHPEDRHLIALNQTQINEEDSTAFIVDSDESIETKIRSVKEKLTEPFLKLFLEGRKSE